MSNKSKRQPRRMSSTALANRYLLYFTWAWVSKCHPPLGDILAVKAEVLNLAESRRKGLVNDTMIAQQLRDECGLETDWIKRDRG